MNNFNAPSTPDSNSQKVSTIDSPTDSDLLNPAPPTAPFNMNSPQNASDDSIVGNIKEFALKKSHPEIYKKLQKGFEQHIVRAMIKDTERSKQRRAELDR